MNPPVIELQHVSFSYGETPIIDDFSLTIRKGSFVCLLGESGSGKSTLLRLMNGLLWPDKGQVRIHDKKLDDQNLLKIRGDMGYVLQSDALFPHFTVYQNMIYCLNLQGMTPSASKKRIDTLLPLVKLDPELLPKFPHELSGGQRQRVGIIRGIAHKPSIVLMDEPFSALDPETRIELRSLVSGIHQELQTTFVMVTHSEEEAEVLSTQVVRL